MKGLGLDSNPMDDEAANLLSKVIHKLEALRIRECNITSTGVGALAEMIIKRDDPVLKRFEYGTNTA